MNKNIEDQMIFQKKTIRKIKEQQRKEIELMYKQNLKFQEFKDKNEKK